MNRNFENLKLLYAEILTANLEMKECISQRDFEALSDVIEQKDNILIKIKQLKLESNFSDDEKADLDSWLKELKIIEGSNITEMEAIKSNITKELSLINKNSRVMSAYKVNTQVDPKLFDSKE